MKLESHATVEVNVPFLTTPEIVSVVVLVEIAVGASSTSSVSGVLSTNIVLLRATRLVGVGTGVTVDSCRCRLDTPVP